MSIGTSIRSLCQMIKIEHSVFALPFAFSGAFMAASGWPGGKTIAFLTLGMVAIRTFAMTVNRVADLSIDSINPRTKKRQLVTGEVTRLQAWIFLSVAALLFVIACWGLNSLCLLLSPFALALAAGYSFTKRFTWLCHFVLGTVLALAPLAGWISVTASISLTPLLLACGVIFWVAGFDILYATQDTTFDKTLGLYSIPARFGIPTALQFSTFCHVNTILFFVLFGFAANLSFAWYIVWFIVSALLLWEHKMLSPKDLSKVNAAFFLMNGLISILVFIGVLLGIYVSWELIIPPLT